MEDSFDIGTIKETNEEYYLENDENQDSYYPKQRYSAKGYSKPPSNSKKYDDSNVLKDRTNKVVNRNVEPKNAKCGLEKGGKNKQVTNSRGKAQREEDSLSSLSGFSGSDNEEPRFKQSPDQQYVQRELEADEDEEEEEEEEEIQIPSKKSKDDELKERFRYYEDLRRKAEEEKRLAGDQQVPKYKRPQTAGGIDSRDTRDVRSSHTNLRQEKQTTVQYSRPQTANPYREETGEEEEVEQIVFRPVYTKPYQQHLIEKKKFNYSLKRFNTLPKKSDPVSRFNAFKNEWNKTKFLKSNSGLLNGRNTLLTSYDKTGVKSSTKKY